MENCEKKKQIKVTDKKKTLKTKKTPTLLKWLKKLEDHGSPGIPVTVTGFKFFLLVNRTQKLCFLKTHFLAFMWSLQCSLAFSSVFLPRFSFYSNQVVRMKFLQFAKVSQWATNQNRSKWYANITLQRHWYIWLKLLFKYCW